MKGQEEKKESVVVVIKKYHDKIKKPNEKKDANKEDER